MDWGEFWTDISVALVTVLVPVILAGLVLLLRPVLRRWDEKLAAENGAREWRLFKDLVVQFVLAAEQRGAWDDLLKEGAARKQWVIDKTTQACLERGLNFGVDEVDAAIEEAVHSWLNDQELTVTNVTEPVAG
ncbi:hypothetical protein ACFLWA_12850 [Chloroflexota bacterium]